MPGRPNSKRYFNLGLLYCFTNDFKTARRIYLKSIRLYPLNPKPYGLFYSAIFAKSRELAEALPVWRDSTTSG